MRTAAVCVFVILRGLIKVFSAVDAFLKSQKKSKSFKLLGLASTKSVVCFRSEKFNKVIKLTTSEMFGREGTSTTKPMSHATVWLLYSGIFCGYLFLKNLGKCIVYFPEIIHCFLK